MWLWWPMIFLFSMCIMFVMRSKQCGKCGGAPLNLPKHALGASIFCANHNYYNNKNNVVGSVGSTSRPGIRRAIARRC